MLLELSHSIAFLTLNLKTSISLSLSQDELFIFMVHVVGIFVGLLTLLIIALSDNTSAMFMTLASGGAWHTDRASFVVGLQGFTFILNGSSKAIKLLRIMLPSRALPLCTRCSGFHSDYNRRSIMAPLQILSSTIHNIMHTNANISGRVHYTCLVCLYELLDAR